MSSRPATTAFTGASPAEAISLALTSVITPGMRDGEQASATLVFSGEGPTPGSAIAAALEDIRGQCADHGVRPLEVSVDNVFRTDEGTRVWGTVECAPGDTGGDDLAPVDWQIEKTGEGEWTVTITRA